MSRVRGVDTLSGFVRVEVYVPISSVKLYLGVEEGELHASFVQGFIDDAEITDDEWLLLETNGAQVPSYLRRFPFYGPAEFCGLREHHGAYVRLDEVQRVWVCRGCGRAPGTSADNPEGLLMAGRTPGGMGIFHATNGRGFALCRGRNAKLVGIVPARDVPKDQRCRMPVCKRAWEGLGEV